MAIFRCKKCGHMREVGSDYVGKLVKCPKCDDPTKIYDTVVFIQALIQTHMAQKSALHELRKEFSIENTAKNELENPSLEDIDIYNTNIFAQEQSFAPLIKWFKNKNMQVQIDPSAVDTTGFFDEIALLLGDNFNLLSSVSNQIKYVQNKGYTTVKLELANKNQKEIQTITSFCKKLHDYSFVSRYRYQKKNQIIYLGVQTAPKIRNFFNGIWMEWFAFIKLLDFFRQSKIMPAIGKNLEISNASTKINELDIFVLTEKEIPICIECKTGEFREDINKYLTLRKQLNLAKNQFVICVFGLSQEQAQGLNSMYELTFVNENNLIEHIKTVI